MNEKMMGKVSKKTKENLGKYSQIILQNGMIVQKILYLRSCNCR